MRRAYWTLAIPRIAPFVPIWAIVPIAAIVVVASTALVAAADERQSPAAALTYSAALTRALSANPRIVAARLRRPVNIASRDVAAERLNPENAS